MIGGVLAILIIFLFLRDGWSTFVISLSLPVSIITTFFFMGQLGLSLNVMSLGGLALATGLVVDDSIVVLESIAKARERGLGVLDAAIAGTREVSMAVMASTLTTIAVFLPLVFVEGIAGQLFRDQALTVAIAIAISLVVSMTLIPMLSSLKGAPPMAFPDEPSHPDWRPEQRWLAGGGRAARRGCERALCVLRCGVGGGEGVARVEPRGGAGDAQGQRPGDGAVCPCRAWLSGDVAGGAAASLVGAGAGAAAFIGTVFLVPMLGADLIPQLAQDRFEMTVKLPSGTPLAQTDAVVRELQLAHDKDPGVASLYGVSGSGTRLMPTPPRAARTSASSPW